MSTSLRTNLSDVWKDYGRWKALFSSGYLWVASLVTAAQWRTFGEGGWAEVAIVIMPPVLGLTLAAAAILTSIGGDAFRQRLAQIGRDQGDQAPIIQRLSAFIFAMVVQIASLLVAVVFKAKPFASEWLPSLGLRIEVADWVNFVVGALGCLLLVYGIMLILGAAFSIRALAVVYVRDARREADGQSSETSKKPTRRSSSPQRSRSTAQH